MQEKINKQKSLPESLFWVSLVLGVVFWIVDTSPSLLPLRITRFCTRL